MKLFYMWGLCAQCLYDCMIANCQGCENEIVMVMLIENMLLSKCEHDLFENHKLVYIIKSKQ